MTNDVKLSTQQNGKKQVDEKRKLAIFLANEASKDFKEFGKPEEDVPEKDRPKKRWFRKNKSEKDKPEKKSFVIRNGEKWLVILKKDEGEQSGFDGYMFFNPKTEQFVIAFRGTEFKLNKRGFKDMMTDVKDFGMANMKMGQYLSAKSFVEDSIKKIGKLTEEQLGKYGVEAPEDFDKQKALDNLIITGHSLGGGLAQLIGAQKAFSGYRVETFDAIGTKEFENKYRRQAIKDIAEGEKRHRTLKEIFNPGSIDLDYNSPFIKNSEYPEHDFSGDYGNITNHVISRDGVSPVYGQLGAVRVYKPAEEYRLFRSKNTGGERAKDVGILVRFYRAFRAHDTANYLSAGAWDEQPSKYTYQNLGNILRKFNVQELLQNFLAPLLVVPLSVLFCTLAGIKTGYEETLGRCIGRIKAPLKKGGEKQSEAEAVPEGISEAIPNLIKIMLSEGLKDAYAEASGRKRGGIFSGAVKSDRTLEMAAERGRLKDLQDKIINFYACGGLDGLCTRIPKPENYLAGDRPFQGIATGAAAPVDNTMDAEPEITTKVRSISEINAEKIRRRKPVEGWRLDERIRRVLAQEIDNANIALGFDITRRR